MPLPVIEGAFGFKGVVAPTRRNTLRVPVGRLDRLVEPPTEEAEDDRPVLAFLEGGVFGGVSRRPAFEEPDSLSPDRAVEGCGREPEDSK